MPNPIATKYGLATLEEEEPAKKSLISIPPLKEVQERIVERQRNIWGGRPIQTSPETYEFERMPLAKKFRSVLYGTEEPRFKFQYRYDEPLLNRLPKATLESVEDTLDIVAPAVILIELARSGIQGLKDTRKMIQFYRTKVPSEAEYWSKFTPQEIAGMNKEAEALKALKRVSPEKYRELYQFAQKQRIIPLAERLAKGETIFGKEAKFPVELGKALAPVAKPTPLVPKAIPKISLERPPIVPEVKPELATPEQIKQAHVVARQKLLISEKGKVKPQYRFLAKQMTGKTSVKKMTLEESDTFISAMKSLVMRPNKPPRIPRTTDVITKDFAEKIPTLREIGVAEKVRPAWRVFEKIGLYKEIFDPTFRAEIATVEELMAFREKARGYQRMVPRTPEETIKLFNALENPGTVKLTDVEKRVVQWGKKFYDSWADRLKLPVEKRRTNYITHIFEAEATEALKKKYPFPADLIAAMDFYTPKTVFNPFLQERLGRTAGLKQDFWAALQAYENRALKKFYYEPLIQRIRVYEKYLPPNARRYLRNYVARITGRPLVLDREVNQTLKEAAAKIAKLPGGDKLATILTRGNASGLLAYNMTGILYESFLGLRPASAIKNLSQHGLALAEAGPLALAEALTALPKERAKLLANSLVLRSRQAGYLPGIDETFIRSLESKRRKATMFMFRIADRKNVSDAFLAGYYEAKAKGLPDDWAFKRGDEVAMKTQYVYTKFAGAEWTQTAPGRVLGVFTTWPQNWAEIMNDWIQAKPSRVYTDYQKQTGNIPKPTNWIKRRKSLWIYLSLVSYAMLIERKTRLRALAYTGWTSLRSMANLAKGDFAGLTIPGSVAQIVAGIMTGDKRMLKAGWREIRPDRFVIIVRELSDIIEGKKDWLNLFFYLEREKKEKVREGLYNPIADKYGVGRGAKTKNPILEKYGIK